MRRGRRRVGRRRGRGAQVGVVQVMQRPQEATRRRSSSLKLTLLLLLLLLLMGGGQGEPLLNEMVVVRMHEAEGRPRRERSGGGRGTHDGRQGRHAAAATAGELVVRRRLEAGALVRAHVAGSGGGRGGREALGLADLAPAVVSVQALLSKAAIKAAGI